MPTNPILPLGGSGHVGSRTLHDGAPRRVLVTGARAKTGAPLVGLLSDRSDVEVRAGSRDPAGLELPRARPVAFDWDDRSTWFPAAGDVDALFIVRPDREDAPELVAGLLAATPASAHVVLLSEVDGGYFPADAWTMLVERAVRDSGRTWTLLRPTWFMQVLTDPRFFRDEVVGNGRLPFVSAGRSIAWIDTRDIAAVASRVLVESGHHGHIHELSGPEALTLERTAELLTRFLGHPVRHVELSMDDALGDSAGFARLNDYGAFDRVRRGMAAEVTGTVQAITGAPARSLEQFLAEYAG